MPVFEDFKLTTPLRNALADLGFERPTPIQEQAFSVILSGKDMVGIAQTGTGKTLAYMLPILRDLSFSEQLNPRVLVLVPTRELVVQVVEQVQAFAKYMNVRVMGVYGGTTLSTQAAMVQEGMDVLVATPGRLYDLVIDRSLALKDVRKFVIDEVDVMLDLGFRFQLTNILELLPERRQNLLFSATMTEEVETMIEDFFANPQKISIAVSGTRLENIEQSCYQVRNFYTKVNLLEHLIRDKETFSKVLVFLSNKKSADRLFEQLEPMWGNELCIVHSNKSQNYRLRSVKQFDEGKKRVLIATDVMARGLDMEKVTHVINFDTPAYPENYMHRIGRTGRAEEAGKTILFYTEKEEPHKQAIEKLMNYEIPELEFPEEVEINPQLTPEEKPKRKEINTGKHKLPEGPGPAFHEKKEKNKKTNQGGSWRRKMEKKHANKKKKPKGKRW
ncbi:DEAD/DEAH box helicase [Marinoscillum furvescens]|uniref:ATP-dependent RNA helicase RhlE n=1 Tax=Marinoscillum furvescens DSM 4134 TaxID=1122208 RepID=A0A3D9L2G6_MARFU|nr:DEAD/DEAH box helicase [Marinoscillum furvescens]RED96574.1 ATP-dependent RNA helicase RhlE [Marinoscillum furvescens DSM 4134]